MSAPAWAKRGTVVVCVDDHFVDILDTGASGVFPKRGELYTIDWTFQFCGRTFVRLADTCVSDEYYGIGAFRPLTDAEQRDRAAFRVILKDAAASSHHAAVRA